MQTRDTNVILIPIVETISQHFPAQIPPVWKFQAGIVLFHFSLIMPRITKMLNHFQYYAKAPSSDREAPGSYS